MFGSGAAYDAPPDALSRAGIRSAASLMRMPANDPNEPMDLGAATAPAAAVRGRRALSGDDGAEEPPPTRRRVEDLEAGRPPALLMHGVEIVQALIKNTGHLT